MTTASYVSANAIADKKTLHNMETLIACYATLFLILGITLHAIF